MLSDAGFPEVVAWLLAAGAELDVRDDNGCTALHLACLRAGSGYATRTQPYPYALTQTLNPDS